MTVPRQLEMRHTRLSELPPLEPPAGCTLRCYQPGDEADWAEIMNHCIGMKWTAARCRVELIERREFDSEGCFFALVDGIPQGTATAWQKPEQRGDTGYVHMVGVSPAYRGQGLGRLVTLAVLHWLRGQGYRRVILHTDEWRLLAIRTYLRLGFRPVFFDDHHMRRWDAVENRLRARFPTEPGGLDVRSP